MMLSVSCSLDELGGENTYQVFQKNITRQLLSVRPFRNLESISFVGNMFSLM